MSHALPPRIDGAAPEPVAHTSGHPKPADGHTEANSAAVIATQLGIQATAHARVRHCTNCLRFARTDTIPATQIGTYPIPAFTVCGYCGWATEIEETA